MYILTVSWLQNNLSIDVLLSKFVFSAKSKQSKLHGVNLNVSNFGYLQKNLQERRGQRRTLQNRIDMKKQSIDRQDGEAVDLNKEEDRINNKIMRITIKKCSLLKAQMEHTEKCLKASMQKVGSDA